MSNEPEKINLSEFEYVLKLAQLVSDSIKEKGADKANVIASDFLTKTTQSCLSIWSLIINYPRNIFARDIIDYPSALTLLRTVIEAYVNFNYVLIAPCDTDERRLRILLFERHSLYERKKMLSFINNLDSEISKISKEIKLVTKKIKQNSVYLGSCRSCSDSLKNTEQWCRKEYQEFDKRADLAGMKSDTKKTIYKFLSNYVHSFPLSLEQINAVFDEREIYGIVKFIIDNTSIFLALIIDLFAQINIEAEKIIENKKDFKDLVRDYKGFLAKDLKKVKMAEE